MAREAPFGLILRRGPSKQVCTIGWNRTDDTFELGQWLKGKIYEHRCDLSSDGEYFLYFAAKHKALWKEGPTAWTAVSRVPYLKAVAFWGQDESFTGGGQFHGDRLYYKDKIERETPGQQSYLGKPSLPYLWDSGENEIYDFRLRREGWQRAEIRPGLDNRERQDCDTELWEKTRNSWTLQQFSHGDLNAPFGRGVFWQSYEAQDLVTGETLGDQSWEWADFDGDRLVWAQHGKLLATKIWDGGHGDITELADFNDWKFKNIVAPY